MAKGIQKFLHNYLARFRMPARAFPTSRLLAACKHPKTPSFSDYRSRSENRDEAATLQDVDCFLAENFASLYQDDAAEEEEEEKYEKGDLLLEFAEASPGTPPRPTPGDANSLADEARPSSVSSFLVHSSPCPSFSSLSAPESDNAVARVPDETLAVVTYSDDPYVEFYRSMHDVMASRWARGVAPPDWDFFGELLLCYLGLNERRVHKYILGAFVDLVTGFRQGFGREDLREIPETRKKKVEEGETHCP